MPALSRTTIISGADEPYFPHLRGLVDSIKAHQPSGADISLSVLDLGLSIEQRQELTTENIAHTPAIWNFDFPGKPSCPRWVQGQTSRAFLRDYFPGHEIYIWLDADIWLQDWRVIELLIAGAAAGNIAVVPELHCKYPYIWGHGPLPAFNVDLFTKAFGAEAAHFMYGKPIINSGAFAIAHDSPAWSAYADFKRRGFNRWVHKWTEQCALNLAIHYGGLSVAMLPAWCNWISSYALPVYDPVNRCLCEPLPPYQKISAVHIAGAKVEQLMTTQGTPIPASLDYASCKQLLE